MNPFDFKQKDFLPHLLDMNGSGGVQGIFGADSSSYKNQGYLIDNES